MRAGAARSVFAVEQLKPPGDAVAMYDVTLVTPLALGWLQVIDAEAAIARVARRAVGRERRRVRSWGWTAPSHRRRWTRSPRRHR